jgi:hypothetical protein
MKKTILTAMLIGMVGIAKAQWTYKKIDNGIDPSYRIAYTQNDRDTYLKMETIDGNVNLYLKGIYFCGESVNVDVSFWVIDGWKRYNFDANVGSSKSIVWIEDALQNETNFLSDFLSATKMRLRVNYSTDDVCTSTIYEYSMGNSTKAFQFMKTE